jgi:hypothetical protein
MSLHPQQVLLLKDRAGHVLGQVTVASVTGDLVLGQFTPAGDFPIVEHLFRDFEEAANQQMLSIVDDVGAALDALNLELCPSTGQAPLPVHDAQLMNGHDFSCRLRPVAGTGAAAPAFPGRAPDITSPASTPQTK